MKCGTAVLSTRAVPLYVTLLSKTTGRAHRIAFAKHPELPERSEGSEWEAAAGGPEAFTKSAPYTAGGAKRRDSTLCWAHL